jgi:hypothetical protein
MPSYVWVHVHLWDPVHVLKSYMHGHAASVACKAITFPVKCSFLNWRSFLVTILLDLMSGNLQEQGKWGNAALLQNVHDSNHQSDTQWTSTAPPGRRCCTLPSADTTRQRMQQAYPGGLASGLKGFLKRIPSVHDCSEPVNLTSDISGVFWKAFI